MDSSKERAFYEALGRVPEVPAGILENVERCVSRRGVKRRLALAASLLLAFIIPALILTQPDNAVTSLAYASEYEAMDELMYAFEFLSGRGDFSASCMFGFDSVVNGNGSSSNGVAYTNVDSSSQSASRENDLVQAPIFREEITNEF